jgi:hypothetical protein
MLPFGSEPLSSLLLPKNLKIKINNGISFFSMDEKLGLSS